MNFDDYVFIPLGSYGDTKTKDTQKTLIVFANYDAKEKLASISGKKAVIVTNLTQAQNARNLKAGKTKAGVIDVIIYKPDFSETDLQKTFRTIIEHNWCDGVLDLHLSPKKDGLHKKYTYCTQVEAKIMGENNIALLFSDKTEENVSLSRVNRLIELNKLSKKYGFKIHSFSLTI